MTNEQREKLTEIGKQIREVFPDVIGNVFCRFNLHPDRKDVNMNIGFEQSIILKPADGERKNV